ncbi:MAG TPA: alpha/beta fold hydrolase [Acidimicrobiales bacterium]|nr:alpha/beta fold hydrolase [Acidimicrobiales bacterium]
MAERAVLLVHGFASSFERNWRQPGWVDVLEEEGHRVLGVDLLGHGGAAKPAEPEAYRDLESCVEAALPASEVVDAVGFSLGGQLLLRLAARSPRRFGRIALGGVGDNVFSVSDPEPAARAVEEGLAGESGHHAAGAFARFAQAPGNDPAALAACLRRPHEPLTEEELSQVALPVLVVLGDRDFAGPADRLVAALPDARLVSLAGADHFGTPQDFRFIEAVVDFLSAG